jgi:hypothetical protein
MSKILTHPEIITHFSSDRGRTNKAEMRVALKTRRGYTAVCHDIEVFNFMRVMDREDSYCFLLGRSLMKGGVLNVCWTRGGIYGPQAKAYYGDEVAYTTSGTGYNKQSHIGACILCYMFPPCSKAFSDVQRCAGAGIGSLQTKLAVHGYDCDHSCTPQSDTFVIRKKEGVEPDMTLHDIYKEAE